MRRKPGSDGYVTLAVLLTAALLAAVVSGLVAASRPALGLARIGAEEVAADALLQGGMEAAAYLLFRAKRPAADVDAVAMRRAAGAIRLHVTDESGRIDINAAQPELLQGLYAAVGGRSLTPVAFASRVVDWRDPDDEVGEEGAEADGYRSAGLPYVAPNRRFRSVEEMRLVLGLSGDDFRALRPFLTTYTGSPAVDPLSASITVLRAVPGLSGSAIQLIVNARREGLDREAIVALVPQGATFLSTKESSVYRVGVEIRLTGGRADAVEAVIIGPQPAESADYRVVAWSRRPSSEGRQ